MDVTRVLDATLWAITLNITPRHFTAVNCAYFPDFSLSKCITSTFSLAILEIAEERRSGESSFFL
jgi:hypothetical protein